MRRAPGRDQREPMERLARLLYVLAVADGRPVPIDRLVAVGTYGAAAVEDRRDQVRRDLRHLVNAGWCITSDNPDGGDLARYRLVAVDNRLRVQFTPGEQLELLRAARIADLDRLRANLSAAGEPASGSAAPDRPARAGETADGGSFRAPAAEVSRALEVIRHAAHRHCLLRFTYKGRPRLVHPYAVHARTGGWYLTAREDAGTVVKTFVVDRMTAVSADPPGTAEVPPSPVRPHLDPVSWLIDPPLDAVVATTAVHQPQVVALLGVPSRVETPAAGGSQDEVVLTIPVTNRSAFRGRLYQLGTRVRLLGPPTLRAEVRAELSAVIAAGEPRP